MIVKKIKIKKMTKTKARQIADLVDYIRYPRDTNPEEKIEHSDGLNFLSETHAGQRAEMISLAEESVHSKMPVSHWIFSWKENEQPRKEQVDEVVDIFLRHMGLEGHQVVYALHYNTANYHLHIAVNRMNEQTMKVVDSHGGFDIEAAHQVLAFVEHRQGWSSEKNARYAVNEQGTVVPRAKACKSKPKQPALDFECATGAKSAQRIAQERGHGLIQHAVSWAELHSSLAAAGLRFERKGSGAIIFVGDTAVKASSVDRAFSLKKLEKRLGAFVPGDYPEEKASIPPEPVSEIGLAEWRQYQDEYAAARREPPLLQEDAIARMKSRHEVERKTKPANFVRQAPGLFNFARRCLKYQHKKELHDLRADIRKARLSNSRTLRFEDWLRCKDLHGEAESWRHRRILEAVPPHLREAPPLPTGQTYDPAKAYAQHRKSLCKSNPDMEPSRMDALIALYMRKNGFSREAIVNALLQCAPQAQPEQADRDWQRYTERVANFAFGVEGDIRLAHSAAHKEEEKQQASQAQAQKAELKRDEQKPEGQRTESPRFRLR